MLRIIVYIMLNEKYKQVFSLKNTCDYLIFKCSLEPQMSISKCILFCVILFLISLLKIEHAVYLKTVC